MFEQALAILGADVVCARRGAPDRFDIGRLEHLLRAAALGVRHQQDGNALLAGAARAARTVKQRRLVAGNVGVDDEAEVGQVEATGSDVGGDADLRVAIAQRLQRIIALALAHLAGQTDSMEAALAQAGVEMANGFARVAEHKRASGFEITQHVDDGAFGVAGRDAHGAVFDIAVGFGCAGGVDTDCIALVVLRQHGDAARDGGGEQHGAARFRRRLKQRFQFIAKTEVEHLVGFVEHGDLEVG